MALINRDPFAREELHRETVDSMGVTCSWCGSVRKDNKLYVYYTETDGGRRHTHNGSFCCKSCHDAYHS